MTAKDERILQARRVSRPRALLGGGVSPEQAERRVEARQLDAAPLAGTPEDPDELRAATLETLIARLVAKQASGQIGYWAEYLDERGVSHCAFTTDPAYADLSPANAASRTGAVAAIDRAIERYRAARSSGALPAGPGIPAMAEGSARSSVEAAGTAVARAPAGNGPPAPGIPAGAAGLGMSVAPSGEPVSMPVAAPEAPAAIPVCPYLGFGGDPSTRYDFPDPANLCHATSARGATSAAFTRRFVTGMAGTRRPQPVETGHQASSCLTAAHRRCARYPAAGGARREPLAEREGAPSA